jgi:hypothetical protein
MRFDVTTEISQVNECNCSICTKRGALWTFADSEQFSLKSGEDDLKDYQFGKKRIHHLFCVECGTQAFARRVSGDGKETFAINVRCLDGVDVAGLTRVPFDGKSL